MSLGTLVIDEIILPIRSITLNKGLIIVTAVGYGDFIVSEDADITIFCPDGTLIFHTPALKNPGNYFVSMNGSLTVNLPIQIMNQFIIRDERQYLQPVSNGI